ncbi:AMP-binding protein [Dongshaea marina]|uniref:AMP-binding protein n=1 Tax=Dongshaea marina TaxID=2047966 RepID=UPI000D3E6D4E|nr:AMP-binding protein [Dongshaea marina]
MITHSIYKVSHSNRHGLLAFGSHEVSYQQFHQQLALLATELRQQPAQLWLLNLEDSYLFCLALFACLHAQKTPVMLPNNQPGTLQQYRDHYEQELNEHTLGQLLLGENQPLPLKPLTPEQQLILYSSGSTAAPKKIVKSLQQLDDEIQVLSKQLGPFPNPCRFYASVSHQHIYGLLFRVLLPLCLGHAFARETLEYPEELLAISQQQHHAIVISSPALLKRLDQQAAGPLAQLISSGGPLPYQAAQIAHKLFGLLPTEILGSTETGGIAWRQQHQSDSPWTPLPEVEVGIDSSTGCMTVSSPFVSEPCPYVSADLMHYVDGQRFLLDGRADRIIKLEEKRISLPEIEQRLKMDPWIAEVAIIPVNREKRIMIGAIIRLTTQGAEQFAQQGKLALNRRFQQQLRPYIEPIAVPRLFRYPSDIPVNAQGKLVFTQLQAMFESKEHP